MLRNLFTRHQNATTFMERPDSTFAAGAPAQEWATLGTIAVPQAGPAAARYISPTGSLSPVARTAVERIVGHPIA